eukprot:CAMPEP_0119414680 /NCGR_PEP_ID=MMETSP1335-20130426/7120_1 /TAXON_ID=259385 /ORGANISM="Chrysoculter rhomboideus, Strain RCC1486" /LENGTH=189 /DNA_ID=CAMNT_0007439567 /DNA_START=29 /DNA_END=598 /DNA_ORIENTATION=-
MASGARAIVLVSAVLLVASTVVDAKPLKGSPACSSRVKPLNRRGMLGSFLPVLAMRPLATLAVTQYLPPGSETEDFKALDSRASDFERKQAAYRAEWKARVNGLLSAQSDAEVLAAFDTLRASFRKTGGSNLPEGVSRDAFLKTCRRKEREMEAAGMWGKEVSLSFLDLKTEIDKSRAPKKMGEGPAFG